MIDADNRGIRYLASGCIKTAAGPFPDRLAEIYQGVVALIAGHRPEVLALIARPHVDYVASAANGLGRAAS